MNNDKLDLDGKPYGQSIICITAEDGRMLLAIHPDGTVEGEVEDAGEAARRFIEALRLDLAVAASASLIVRVEAAEAKLAALADSDRQVAEMQAAVEAVLERPVYLHTKHRGYTEEDYSRPLVEANKVRAALTNAPADALAVRERAAEERGKAIGWDEGEATGVANAVTMRRPPHGNPYRAVLRSAQPDTEGADRG